MNVGLARSAPLPPTSGPVSSDDNQALRVSRRRAAGRAASSTAWVAIRGTGALLSILVLGHLLFVHLLTDVSHTGASFVARRWSNALWITWDGTMLTAALLHGTIGAATVIRDYTRRISVRRTWVVATVILSTGLAVLGWYVIVATVLAGPTR
jgi:succinate dehydrogenase hydrophobic anchor subunit